MLSSVSNSALFVINTMEMFTQPSKKFAKLKTVYVCSRMIRLATQLTPTIFKINSAVRSVIANILSMT